MAKIAILIANFTNLAFTNLQLIIVMPMCAVKKKKNLIYSPYHILIKMKK